MTRCVSGVHPCQCPKRVVTSALRIGGNGADNCDKETPAAGCYRDVVRLARCRGGAKKSVVFGFRRFAYDRIGALP